MLICGKVALGPGRTETPATGGACKYNVLGMKQVLSPPKCRVTDRCESHDVGYELGPFTRAVFALNH